MIEHMQSITTKQTTMPITAGAVINDGAALEEFESRSLPP